MMVEVNGKMFHAVPTQGTCSADKTSCHFMNYSFVSCSSKRMHLCSARHGAPHDAMLLTRDEYIKHIAAKLTA